MGEEGVEGWGRGLELGVGGWLGLGEGVWPFTTRRNARMELREAPELRFGRDEGRTVEHGVGGRGA